MPEQVPAFVKFSTAGGVRFTPNEIRALKAETGRTLTDMLGPDADDADRMQTIAWLNLRRDGNAVAWADCGDVAIEVETPTPDPTSEGR
jgi:hypothetical protein